jgi:hypothetical protein
VMCEAKKVFTRSSEFELNSEVPSGGHEAPLASANQAAS